MAYLPSNFNSFNIEREKASLYLEIIKPFSAIVSAVSGGRSRLCITGPHLMALQLVAEGSVATGNGQHHSSCPTIMAAIPAMKHHT